MVVSGMLDKDTGQAPVDFAGTWPADPSQRAVALHAEIVDWVREDWPQAVAVEFACEQRSHGDLRWQEVTSLRLRDAAGAVVVDADGTPGLEARLVVNLTFIRDKIAMVMGSDAKLVAEQLGERTFLMRLRP